MSGDEQPTVEHTRSTRLSALWSRRWRTRVLVVALVSAVAIGVGGLSLGMVQTRASEEGQRAEQEEVRAEQEEVRADEATTAAEALCAQVQSLGGFCVVDPENLRGEPGPEGPAGPGPSDEQVAEAVAAYLAANPPRPGRPPTMQEIADAVAIQLASNPPEQGERGPGPTQEQILAAVTSYLIANPPEPGPTGPTGPTGPAGADGEDGEDGEDGAESTVPGPPGEPVLSWTFTTRDVLGQETTHRCVRDEPFDPNAPTYTCSPVEPEPGD